MPTAHDPVELKRLIKQLRRDCDRSRLTLPPRGSRRGPKVVGVSQEELAEKLGCSVSTVALWENGIRQMPTHVVEQLVSLVGLDHAQRTRLWRLVYGTDPPAAMGAFLDPVLCASGWVTLVEQFDDPAYVSNPWWEPIVRNSAFTRLFPDAPVVPERAAPPAPGDDRSMMRWVLLNPRAEEVFDDYWGLREDDALLGAQASSSARARGGIGPMSLDELRTTARRRPDDLVLQALAAEVATSERMHDHWHGTSAAGAHVSHPQGSVPRYLLNHPDWGERVEVDALIADLAGFAPRSYRLVILQRVAPHQQTERAAHPLPHPSRARR